MRACVRVCVREREREGERERGVCVCVCVCVCGWAGVYAHSPQRPSLQRDEAGHSTAEKACCTTLPAKRDHTAGRCSLYYYYIFILYLFHWPVGKAGYRYRQTNVGHTPTQYTRHNSWPAKTGVGMWSVQPAHAPLPPPPHLCLYYTYRMCQVINRCAGLQVGEPTSHT